MNHKTRIVYLIPFLASLLLIPSVHADPLSVGYLGGGLSYSVDGLSVIKVGENASVFIKVCTSAITASVDRIRVVIYGPGISPTPYLGLIGILAENTELHWSDSVNKTISVKPTAEGTVAIDIDAHYNWTDFRGNHTDELASNNLYIQAKTNTNDELTASVNTYRNLTYILTITTIAFIATTIYALTRKTTPKHTHTYPDETKTTPPTK